MQTAPPLAGRPPAVRWPHDAVVGLVVAAFVGLTGPVVGLIWSATAPKMSIRQAVGGSEEPFQAQIADDGHFLVLAVIAGLVCAALVLLLRAEGPGVMVGLAVGGVIAAVLANQVAIVAQHDGTVVALRALGIHATGRALDTIGFKVRASGVVMAWPIASVVVAGIAAALRADHR
jgi:hypothetical protein